MGKVYEKIDETLGEFIRGQQMFFVATGPLSERGHINLSPKGHGRGEVLEPHDREFNRLRGLFPAEPAGRAIVRILVTRIADSCGYGVPLYSFEGHRSQLPEWMSRKGAQGLLQYQQDENRSSIDGLPALQWPETRR